MYQKFEKEVVKFISGLAETIEARNLFDIEEIIKFSIEEGGFDIETHDFVVVVVGICENYLHTGEFDNWSICFCKVNTLAFVGECPTDANGLMHQEKTT